MSDQGHEISLSSDADITVEPNLHELASEDITIDQKSIQALTLAVSGMVEAIVRKVVDTGLPAMMQPLIEQSLQTVLPEMLPKIVAEELPKITEKLLRSLGPGLMDSAVTGQQALLTQVIEDVTRQSLPGMMGPIVERLAKDTIQTELQKLVSTAGPEIIEKVAWEVVPSQAEIEVKKEIERLTAES